jgi:hypothetical protein
MVKKTIVKQYMRFLKSATVQVHKLGGFLTFYVICVCSNLYHFSIPYSVEVPQFSCFLNLIFSYNPTEQVLR